MHTISAERTSSLVREQVAPKLACVFFKKGRCKNGENCKFLHEEATEGLGTGFALQDATPTKDSRRLVPCRFYAQRRCQLGNDCKYAHSDLVEEGNDHTTTSMPHAQGKPPLGNANFSSHSKLFQEATNITNQDCQGQEEPECDNLVRKFGGATIHFGPGAEISEVSLESDFSAVRIMDLPFNGTPEHVAALLKSLDFDIDANCIKVSPSADCHDTSNAFVKVEDPSFAGRVCRQLAARRLEDPNLKPRAAICNTSLGKSSTTSRVDSKKVYCSWHKITQMVWLNFGVESVAKRVSTKFNTSRYKILGRQVKCSEPEFSEPKYSGRGSFRLGLMAKHNKQAWTLRLHDVHGTAKEEDVLGSITADYDKPRHVEMRRASCQVDDETAYSTVKSLLTKIGPLEWWENTTQATGKRMKAKARFQDEQDAREAVKGLNMTSIPTLGNRNLTVSLVHGVKYKIATSMYDAIRGQIELERFVWENDHLNLVVYRNTDVSKRFSVLKIEGESLDALLKAKKTLEQILQGTIAMEGKEPLWSQSLARNGPSFQKLKTIEKDLSVVISRNVRLSRLHMYGSLECCKEAEERIRVLIASESPAIRTIELPPQKVSWAVTGGFRSIIGALGEGKAILDIVSKPKTIRISGTKQDYEKALSLIADQASFQEGSSGNNECAVCYTEAENRIQTFCSHVYCLDCFENLCSAAASDERAFPLRCCGEAATCNTVFPLQELKEYLSSAAFEDLLESSFVAHIRQHPETFRYCPSPDCGFVYRTAISALRNTYLLGVYEDVWERRAGI
ncbi:MAG: hypothetical protein Q9227_000180 [Pyrenula ochraceoflavens]